MKTNRNTHHPRDFDEVEITEWPATRAVKKTDPSPRKRKADKYTIAPVREDIEVSVKVPSTDDDWSPEVFLLSPLKQLITTKLRRGEEYDMDNFPFDRISDAQMWSEVGDGIGLIREQARGSGWLYYEAKQKGPLLADGNAAAPVKWHAIKDRRQLGQLVQKHILEYYKQAPGTPFELVYKRGQMNGEPENLELVEEQ